MERYNKLTMPVNAERYFPTAEFELTTSTTPPSTPYTVVYNRERDRKRERDSQNVNIKIP